MHRHLQENDPPVLRSVTLVEMLSGAREAVEGGQAVLTEKQLGQTQDEDVTLWLRLRRKISAHTGHRHSELQLR